MTVPILPTHRIVVFDGELLGSRGDDYVRAVVTWYDGYQPAVCIAWFDAHFNGDRYQGMLCEIKSPTSPIDYGFLH
jgi:hypothetical protein